MQVLDAIFLTSENRGSCCLSLTLIIQLISFGWSHHSKALTFSSYRKRESFSKAFIQKAIKKVKKVTPKSSRIFILKGTSCKDITFACGQTLLLKESVCSHSK